jgi:thiol-disulfide isomerase/thioredoxin
VSRAGPFGAEQGHGPRRRVCCSASWCGPCKMIAPVYDQLAARFPRVTFVKAMEDNAPDMMERFAVRGFPSFFFGKLAPPQEFVETNRMSGADASRLQALVEELAATLPPEFEAFAGSGRSLGTSAPSSSSSSKAALLEARLARSTPTEAPATEAPVAKAPPVEELLPNVRMLVEMGFTAEAASRALAMSTGGIEGAIEWLSTHPDGVVEDEAVEEASSSSSSSLTEEEQRAKIQAALEAKRRAKAEAEKAAAKEREVKRREEGKLREETKDALAAAERERARLERQKDAEFARQEKVRVRVRLLEDKIERLRAGGRESEVGPLLEQIKALREGTATSTVPTLSWEERQDRAIEALRTARGGESAMKILTAVLQNAIDPTKGGMPGEEGAKFRTLKTDKPLFQTKIVAINGALLLLKASGFAKSDAGTPLPEAFVFGESPFNKDEAVALAERALAKLR